jgi:glycosyltransferase involved in cell wall biosynthesis
MVENKKIIISCSNAASLINFRGKLIQTLIAKNEIYVITPYIADVITRNELKSMGVIINETDLDRNSISIISDFCYMYQLYMIIKSIKPDIFFAYTLKPVIYGCIVSTVCNIRNINGMLTGLGYTFTDSSNRFSSYLTRQLMTFCFQINKRIKVIFQNNDDRQELIDRKIISEKNPSFVVDGSGVDLSFYSYSAPDISKINFLMVSRLLKSKGVEEFYQAAAMLKVKYPHVKFTLAGGYEPGAQDSIDETLYEKIESGVVIDHLGWINNVRGQIEESTTVVLPSFYREGVPRSLLEALAIGRPIITTDMIGCKETICTTPGYENGFCIPIRSTESLFERMEHLIKHPDEIVFLGKNGRLLAERRFDVHKVNKRMIEIFGMNTLTGTGLLMKN